MNIENINKLIEEIGKINAPIVFDWENCYSGMAWKLTGKREQFPSLFPLGYWLGINEAEEDRLQYLTGSNPGDEGHRLEAFALKSVEEQKAMLTLGLTSLRDERMIRWK